MFEAEVQRGIEILDTEGPEDWRDKVIPNLNRLNMYLCHSCILGLIYGDYVEGIGQLHFDGYADEYGFEAPNHLNEEYDQLEEAWREALG